MGTTGAPWNIPFVEPTDVPRGYPQDSEDLANAIAAGLDAAGGLVAVKHVIFTGTQTASLTEGANVAVTNLSITHEVADAANRLIISAFIGVMGNSDSQGAGGIAVAEDGTLIGIGDAAGSRARVGASGRLGATDTAGVLSHSVTFVHTPGAGSKTYTVRAINVRNATQTVFINRSESDSDDALRPRGASSLVIQEVKV